MYVVYVAVCEEYIRVMVFRQMHLTCIYLTNGMQEGTLLQLREVACMHACDEYEVLIIWFS